MVMQPKTFTLRECSEISKVPYSTLAENVRLGLIGNPVSDSDMYEIVSKGWKSYRIRKTREMKVLTKEKELRNAL